jgi:hypothetical protein
MRSTLAHRLTCDVGIPPSISIEQGERMSALIQDLRYGVRILVLSSIDPATFAVVTLLLMVVALLAC